MTWVQYFDLVMADLIAALLWMLAGVALTITAAFYWRVELTNHVFKPKSGLVLPEDHVVTKKATLQEIQQLGGKP